MISLQLVSISVINYVCFYHYNYYTTIHIICQVTCGLYVKKSYDKSTLWQDKKIYTVSTCTRDTQFSFTMYVVYFSHYINFIIRKSERFVGVLFISISLSKSHYHMKVSPMVRAGALAITW